MPELRGYVPYTLECGNGSSRGLTTYVKQGSTVTFIEMGENQGIEYIIVALSTMGEKIFFVNVYIHAGALDMSNFPDYVFEEPTVLMGDFNARHRDLGSHHTSNGMEGFP